MTKLPYNRTKIVCTIGPASESKEVLKGLIESGMNVARLNFSHSMHDEHLAVLQNLRAIDEELNTHTAVLMDLQGPKIRIGKLEKPWPIEKDDEVIFKTTIKEQEGNELPIRYKTFAKDVNRGDQVLVDDGKVELEVIETNKQDTVRLKVLFGRQIKSKKGVNLPQTKISLPSITKKDRKDLIFGLKHNPDWVALSFVRHAAEILELKQIIEDHDGNARVIAKIEKPQALKNIDEIIAAADAIMVARGDMGVEIQMEDVPMWQKTIIKKCNEAAKPVIVATQMMESMIDMPRPTRAEASDVANAVMDGADALMLSGETSVGKHPIMVVKSMVRIISSMEEQDSIYYQNLDSDEGSPTQLNDKLIVTACKLADETDAMALVGMTVSGYTAYQLAKCRPRAHIYIFTENRKLLNILSLVWGVRAFYYDKFSGTDETMRDVRAILMKNGHVKRGDVMIQTGSMPLNARLRTNMLRIGVV